MHPPSDPSNKSSPLLSLVTLRAGKGRCNPPPSNNPDPNYVLGGRCEKSDTNRRDGRCKKIQKWERMLSLHIQQIGVSRVLEGSDSNISTSISYQCCDVTSLQCYNGPPGQL
eukprot:sb/3477039/